MSEERRWPIGCGGCALADRSLAAGAVVRRWTRPCGIDRFTGGFIINDRLNRSLIREVPLCQRGVYRATNCDIHCDSDIHTYRDY
jgi:hypothetical protein